MDSCYVKTLLPSPVLVVLACTQCTVAVVVLQGSVGGTGISGFPGLRVSIIICYYWILCAGSGPAITA